MASLKEIKSKKAPVKADPPFNLILLGDPGAGKGTQSAWIAKKYDLYDFDMGKELLAVTLQEPSSAITQALRRTASKGHLAPTAIVRQIHMDTILNMPPAKGILFDGTPKMIGEATLVYKWMHQTGRKNEDTLFLYLRIPMSEVQRRIFKRYAVVNGKRVKRTDDSLKALRNRWKYYREYVSATVDFFRKKYVFKSVSGLGSRAEVHKRLQLEITKFLKNRNT